MAQTKTDPVKIEFKFSRDGTEQSGEWKIGTSEITVVDRIDSPSSFTITISDPINQWVDDEMFNEGTEMAVTISALDELSGSQPLIVGYTEGISKRYMARLKEPRVVLQGASYIKLLTRNVHNRTFTEKNVKDIVNTVIQDSVYSNRLSAGEIDPGFEEKLFAVQRKISDFDFLRMLADRFMCCIWTRGKEFNFVQFQKAVQKLNEEGTEKDPPVLELEHNLSGLNISMNTDIFTEVKVLNKPFKVDETAKAGDIEGMKIGSGNLGVKEVESSGGPSVMIVKLPELKDSSSAKIVAQGLLFKNSLNFLTIQGKTEGNGEIRAGSTIAVKGKSLDEKFCGDYFVREAIHHFEPDTGYYTNFTASKNACG